LYNENQQLNFDPYGLEDEMMAEYIGTTKDDLFGLNGHVRGTTSKALFWNWNALIIKCAKVYKTHAMFRALKPIKKKRGNIMNYEVQLNFNNGQGAIIPVSTIVNVEFLSGISQEEKNEIIVDTAIENFEEVGFTVYEDDYDSFVIKEVEWF
jgi:hypothetical protein